MPAPTRISMAHSIAGKPLSFKRVVNTAIGVRVGAGVAYNGAQYANKNIPKKTRYANGYKRHLIENLREGNLGIKNVSSVDRSMLKKHFTPGFRTKIASSGVLDKVTSAVTPAMSIMGVAGMHKSGRDQVAKRRLIRPTPIRPGFRR